MDQKFANEPYFPEALLDSKAKSVLAEIDFDWCSAEELPEIPRKLLAHESDMTSALEAHHGEAITLEVLKSHRDHDVYCREVILRTATSGKPVEYGLIEIELGVFEGGLQASILEGGKPLGGLLNTAGMGYRSSPLGFFRVPAAKLSVIFPEGRRGDVLHGRYNQLFTSDGVLFARIIEILPDNSQS